MSSVDSKLDDIKKLLEVHTSSLQEIKENQAKMKTDFESKGYRGDQRHDEPRKKPIIFE